jgi:DNA modification methylase
VNIPFYVAEALRADGWWLRQDIIWGKPNPMPESVTDRCTKAHEYLFMLTKSARYYWDADALRESAEYGRRDWSSVNGNMASVGGGRGHATVSGADPSAGRNRRSVWTIPTAPYAEAHFATFPPAIPSLCIQASSRPGDMVLDPFAGSGTTGMVALELGRKAVLIELNTEYVEMIRQRCDVTMGMKI